MERGPYFDMLRRLEKFDGEAEVIEQAKQFTVEILDMNRYDQLYYKGIRSDDSSLPGYSKNTRFRKNHPEPGRDDRTQNMTLKDYGENYKGLAIKFEQYQFTIYTNDSKYEMLKEVYGDLIYGLTEENTNELAEVVKPHLVTAFRKLLLDGAN